MIGSLKSIHLSLTKHTTHTAGYVDEAGKLITATVTPSNVFLVPQGLVHFVLNRVSDFFGVLRIECLVFIASCCKLTIPIPFAQSKQDCKPSDAVFVFPPNPGLQFSLAAVGTIPSSTFGYFANGAVPKQKGDLYSSIDQDCLKRCGLNVGGAAAAQGTGAVGASYAKVQQQG
jgi:hypothetical protein